MFFWHENGTAKSTCLRGRAPVGLSMEGSDLTVAVDASVVLQSLQGVTQCLHLLHRQGLHVIADPIFLLVVVFFVHCIQSCTRIDIVEDSWEAVRGFNLIIKFF